MQKQSGGYVLLLTLIQGVVFMIILTGIISLSMENYKTANQSAKDLISLSAAEAGADAAIFNLNVAYNSGSNYTGTTPPVGGVCALATSATSSAAAVILTNQPKLYVTYESCIVDSSAGPNMERTIYSVGKAYAKQGASHPQSVRRVKLISSAQVSGNYSVHTGNGGLVMSNSSTIANGNVYVNGSLTMSNTSQIGSAAAPAQVYVANYECPKTAPYTGYPSLCASSDPIVITNTAHIYADVHANGQVTGAGMSNGGLVQSAGVSTLPLPTYDRAAHQSRVTTTINGNQSCSGSATLTFPANTKINGDLSGGNNCQIILKGDLWVTGNITLNQKALIITDAAVAAMPTIMVDGSSGVVFLQQSGSATNASGIGTQFITFYSTDGCSPNCVNVTDGDLFNSTPITTINLGNQSLSAGSRFFARWSTIAVAQGGAIGSVAGQRILLSNSGGISFSSNLGTTTYSWVARFYDPIPVPDARSTN